MVVLGCNPEWQAVSWLGPEPVNRTRMFRESWLSQSEPHTQRTVAPTEQGDDPGTEAADDKA